MTATDKNARYEVLLHIQENLMDLVDDGKVTGRELEELNISMGEVAGAVLECLGLEIESLNEDKTATAKIKLQNLFE
jgi:hypothetical protein